MCGVFDKNPLPKHMRQKGSFWAQALLTPAWLKRPVPQNLGKTAFDFVTFLAGSEEADIGAECSIRKKGL